MQGDERGRGVEERAVGEKKRREEAKGAMEKDRVRVMEAGSEPETRPQKSNYRSSREGVGSAPRRSFKWHEVVPDMFSRAHIHNQEQKNL